ncbi:hypothetical protein ACET3Z_030736 [Daucus carota]
MAVAIKVHDHPTKNLEDQTTKALETEEAFDYSKRSQWLRAAVLIFSIRHRDGRNKEGGHAWKAEIEAKMPSPLKAAAASALMFAVGAIMPLLAAAFVMDYHVRLMVVIGSVSFALIGFGGLSAMLGKAPVIKSISRVLIGGWLAMGITFGLTKLVGSTGL